ncbi:type II secretion system protein [Candidatus Wolfebacteria bacterium]|nr:type II secretion system protein [Candidatus Wolfebacteria bacterium]
MKKGFTLIEMLIVVAIIAILSSVFLVGLRGFRSSAYDARRLADLQKIQSYLEIYYTKYRCYPSSQTPGCSTGADTSVSWADLGTALNAAGVVNNLPNDPIPGGTYSYGISADRQSYVLGAPLTAGHSAYNEPTTIAATTYGVSCAKDSIFCIKF